MKTVAVPDDVPWWPRYFSPLHVEEGRHLRETLIDAEMGADLHAWVPERPRLFGWPTWHGDAA